MVTKIMSHHLPPKRMKYCEICEKETKWKFNPKIFHSECQECFCRNLSKILKVD
jgi:hypothetical protein